MKKKSKLGIIFPSVGAGVLFALGLTATIVLSGPVYTVMNMYFGTGDLVVKENENSKKLNKEYYKGDNATTEDLVKSGKELAQEVEEDGIVLLKNETVGTSKALPLASTETRVTLFGRTSVDPVYTGAGSAAGSSDGKAQAVDFKTAYTDAGLTVDENMYNFYKNHELSTATYKTDIPERGAFGVEYSGRGFISYMGAAKFVGDIIAEVPGTNLTNSDAYKNATGDVAIVTIGRVGGEGCDLPTNMANYTCATEADKEKSYLELDSREIDLLKAVKAKKDAGAFKKIIVVLNTANALELNFLKDDTYGIDGAIWASCIGDQGAVGVANIITGKNGANPSGCLVDTYVSDLTHDPSYKNFKNETYSNVTDLTGGYSTGQFNEYEEGIYVGYRYYETAAALAKEGKYTYDYDKEVLYPFGYGDSYTTFETKFEEAKLSGDKFEFKVNVKNTGSLKGKKVVQIYAETPYTEGGIEKAKVVLVGFAKTSALEPNADETVTITVNKDELASYDYKTEKAYVLDEGDYKFYLSDNAHSWASLEESNDKKVFVKKLNREVFNGTNKRSTDEVTATNQFDEVSQMFTDTATSGKALNMSRSNFTSTYPTSPTDADKVLPDNLKADLESIFNYETDADLGNVSTSKVYTDSMPTTGANNGVNWIDVRGLDYNDPLWDSLLDELDLDQVKDMLANGGYNTKVLKCINKPATLDYDGPMGWTTWVSASAGDAICIGLPAEELLAATWNVDLAHKVGRLVGEQGLNNGFNGWYAPAVNTHRSAFGGRNYEYMSEDGVLAGKMVASEIGGCMDMGTYVYLKHFALNDKEDGRNGIATWANEQAIREIYLKPFEVAVKEATTTIHYNDENGKDVTKEIKATTGIMSSYNRIGTRWSGENYGLQTQVLRNEWGFHGAVISDYFGGDKYMSPEGGLRAGNDFMLNTYADAALADGKSATSVTAMRKAAKNIIYMTVNSNTAQGLASGSTISYTLANWQKVMIALDIVDGVVVAGLVALAIINAKKYKKAKVAEETK